MEGTHPTTHAGDLAKLPAALASLEAQPCWAIWRWTRQGDRWQKPPYSATEPARHASSTDPSTWTAYATALAAVQAGHGDGITYLLGEGDLLAAIDLDHCRDSATNSIAPWAQTFLERGRGAYVEVTPSGEGLRIWGLASGGKVHCKYKLEIDGKAVAAELFRATTKPLTVTGLVLDRVPPALVNIDKLIDWAVIWGERRRAAAAPAPVAGNGFNGSGGCGYSVEQIEEFVRSGAPAGKNRSDLFHTIVGHYTGCGWDADKILAHLEQFPDGIGGRYQEEGRLSKEIQRSIGKYRGTLPQLDADGWVQGWETKAPAEPEPEIEASAECKVELPSEPTVDLLPEEPSEPPLEEGGEEFDEQPQDPKLPPLFAHGDADPRPLKPWLIKGLIPAVGHGLLSGQFATGKTFVAFDLAVAVGTGQPFLGHAIKRRCGVLLIAAEGAAEVRLRSDAVIRAKCGGISRAPFRWYETAPLLLQRGAVDTLIAMARQAERSLLQEFGLPLGLIEIDTIAAWAGYTQPGAENDNAVGQAIMNTLKQLAETLRCFVLGIDHFGKNLHAGTRGAYSKESSGDVVLACLGNKELSGSVTNTRLAVRKNRGGRQGHEFPFTLRIVEAPEPDEDGDPITTMVVDWTSPGAAQPQPEPDPWAAPRRQDQRTAVLRLQRVIMAELAERGVDLMIPPDGPVVRMIDQEIVRGQFYAHTPADGTAEKQREFRRKRFNRALDWAEERQLIAVHKVGDITYLRLSRPAPESDDEEEAGE